jgi:hypothetical protein
MMPILKKRPYSTMDAGHSESEDKRRGNLKEPYNVEIKKASFLRRF